MSAAAARRARRAGLLVWSILTVGCQPAQEPVGTFIANVTVYDGSGGDGQVMAVRFVGDRLDSIGDPQPATDDWYIDGTGLAIAPGFIDTHSHADADLLEHRDALAAVSQGVTTVVGGQDGGSRSPLREYFGRLDSTPAAINVASFAGHSTLRLMVMGRDDYRRPATATEIDSVKRLLFAELDAGALGLSTGLEYDAAHSATTEEVLALAQVTGAEGGRYISHIRSEDRAFWPAIEEIVRIGRDGGLPVQISHLKLAARSLWGRADSLVAVLDRARSSGVDITADIYPYTYWQSTLRVLFPDRDYDDPAAARFALTEVASPEGLLVGRWTPDSTYVGKTLAEIAKRRRSDPASTLIALIREATAAAAAGQTDVESVIGTSMDENDVQRLIQWEWANICSDGELNGRHPRGFGAFAKVLGPYVRDRNALSLGEAIRKMTSLPARNMGIVDRGVIRRGAYADLVMFDPATIADQATTGEPQKPAVGVRMVWVNGEVVFESGKTTDRYPGRVIRRKSGVVRP